MRRAVLAVVVLALWTGVAFGAASYPTAVKSFSRPNTGDIIQTVHVTTAYDEIEAIESALLGGFQHHLRPLTADTYDLGTATFDWKDLWLGRTANVVQGTLAADTQALNVSATWNGAVAFTLLRANVTDTLSNAASLLLDLQVGGASRFKVQKDGSATLAGTLTIAGAFSGSSAALSGTLTSTLAAALTDAWVARVTGEAANRLVVNADGSIEWGDGTNPADVTLGRAEADVLGLLDELRITRASAGAAAYTTRVAGDALGRWLVFADGTMEWGDGAAARDVQLARAAANVLQLASGDTLRVQQDPSNVNDVTRKGYVDNRSAAGIARILVVRQATAATVTITADAAWLVDAGGEPRRFDTISETADITVSGANGLDTGAEAGSTWYAVWLIARSDGMIDSLLSLSATAPTMPAGYTFKMFAGWVLNDGGSNFVAFRQAGTRALYAARQTCASGIALNATFASLGCGGQIPPSRATAAFWGFKNTSGTNGATLEVSWDGSNTFYYQAISGTTGFTVQGFVLIPIATAQTAYWRETADTSNTYDAYVYGFTVDAAAP